MTEVKEKAGSGMIRSISEEAMNEITKLNNQIAYFNATSNCRPKMLVLSLKQRIAIQRIYGDSSPGVGLTIVEYVGIPILPLEEVLIIE